jgi:hypothetical protein
VIERLHEEFKRRIKTQTVLPSAESAAMLFWALLASGQITMRKVMAEKALSAVIQRLARRCRMVVKIQALQSTGPSPRRGIQRTRLRRSPGAWLRQPLRDDGQFREGRCFAAPRRLLAFDRPARPHRFFAVTSSIVSPALARIDSTFLRALSSPAAHVIAANALRGKDGDADRA